MSKIKSITGESSHGRQNLWLLAGGLSIAALLAGAAGFLVLKSSSLGLPVSNVLAWLFSLNSTQTTWYITRAAGWVAYFLLWFSMVWGLAIPSKFFERVLSPTFAVDFHEYISLLAVGFILLHVGVLLIDKFLPFTIIQILVPFLSTYRPVWVGLGTIGFYLTLLVTITFYLRKKIGQKTFKSIHLLSFLAYLGVVLHAFFAGSDSSLGAVQVTYLATFLVVIFLTTYWIYRSREMKKGKVRHTGFAKPSSAMK